LGTHSNERGGILTGGWHISTGGLQGLEERIPGTLTSSLPVELLSGFWFTLFDEAQIEIIAVHVLKRLGGLYTADSFTVLWEDSRLAEVGSIAEQKAIAHLSLGLKEQLGGAVRSFIQAIDDSTSG
jgi:hypothetical protein